MYHFRLAIVSVLLTMVGNFALAQDAKRTAEQIEKAKPQDKFFKAIESGKSKLLFDLLAPKLREKLDEPVIDAWIAILNKELGAYEGLSWTDFNTSVELVNGKKIQQASGMFLFEKDKVDAKFVYQDGKLINFKVEPRTVGKGWSHRPSTTKLYEDRAIAFLKELANGDIQATYAMTHEALQKEITLKQLQDIRTLVDEKVGRLKTWKIERVEVNTDKLYSLTIFVDMKFEKAKQVGIVKFQFGQLRGHITAFNLAAEGEFADDKHDEATAFFKAIGKNDHNAAMAEIHSSIQKNVDPPVFKAWVNAIQGVLGEYKSADNDFDYKVAYNKGNKLRTGQGKLLFEKGKADAEFRCYGGELAAFKLKTELLPDGWFKGPQEDPFYKDKAAGFLKSLTGQQPAAAFELMHPSLREKISVEQFQKGFGKFTAAHGAVKSIKYTGEKYDDTKGQILVVEFGTEFGNGGKSVASVVFRFIGLKGHILAFDIKPPKADA